jgi:acetyltransferase
MDTTSKLNRPRAGALHGETHPLDPLFSPSTVALIGATERVGSVGRTILWNLISSEFGGTVFPVNLRRSSVLGIRAYPAIAAVPEPVDLAIIVTRASSVPQVVRECVDAHVRTAIVTSAGFREVGVDGLRLEREVVDVVRRGGLRLVGPNCLGVMSPVTGLNASMAATIARPGSVGFISQSGALCTAVLDWSLRMNVGFSHFVSVGSMADVGWGDLIDYLGNDPRTKSIVIYMETVGDARSFLSAAREVALGKPIIVIKAGRTAPGAKAAASHTGALTGADDVLDAAFRRTGVLRVNTIAEMFYMAEVLGKQPRPRGAGLTIISNAGGPGVLATDALVQNGGSLAAISEQALQAYDELLPPEWSHNNPVDIIGDADPERYVQAAKIALADPNSDGLLVVLTPQAATDPTQTAERLKQAVAGQGKPVLASWMGGAEVAAGEAILARAGIPTFPYPDTAARVFAMMWRYSYNIKGLYETPSLPVDLENAYPGRERVAAIVERVRQSGRTLLTEAESKQVLAEYGIPVVQTHVARSADEAVALASRCGYPVVLKVNSGTILHKSEVGGVWLNLCDDAEVRAAYEKVRNSVLEKAGAGQFDGVGVQRMERPDGCEIIIGSSLDPQFGPVLMFGAGGRMVEAYRDRSLGLPPLNTTLARRMMEQTRIFGALRQAPGHRAVDLSALEALMVRLSHLVAEQRWIREIDVNPLLACADRLIALDARVIVHGPETRVADLPRLAIRPYPVQYVRQSTLKDGTQATIRPIRPEDEPAMVRFHEGLSDRSVYLRYFHLLNLSQRIAHERLTRICFIDYDREIALVAVGHDVQGGQPTVMGVGRLTRTHGGSEAEFAIVVADQYQGRGLGTQLLKRLLDVAAEEGVERVTGDMLPENLEMQRVCERNGLSVSYREDTQMLHAEAQIGGK